MTGPGVPPEEIPGFPAPGRVGPELDDELLDALLSGAPLTPGAPGRARVTAEMLASLAGPADAGELAGEEAARAAFVRAAYPDPRATTAPAARRRRSWLPPRGQHQASRADAGRRQPWTPRISVRLAAALTALAIILGGTVAAYAGVLPDPVQNLAHYAIGAPAPRHSHHPARHHPAAPVTTPPAPAPTPQPSASPGGGKHGKTPGHGKTTKGKGHKKAKKPKKAKHTKKAKKKHKKAKKHKNKHKKHKKPKKPKPGKTKKAKR